MSVLADAPHQAPRHFWLAHLDAAPEIQRFAIRALGEIGTADDQALLQQYAASYDFRIKSAATTASRRLAVRLKPVPN